MLGIALGVAALIIVLSVMNGFQKEVRDRMLAVVSHIEIFAPGGAALPDVARTLAQARQNPQWWAQPRSWLRRPCWRVVRT
jgi:lipoprotein-releasing system permease protein